MAKKLTTTIYITEQQQVLLKELNRRSKVPVAEYIRQGIDLVLQKYSHRLPGQMELDPHDSGSASGLIPGQSHDSLSQKGADSL